MLRIGREEILQALYDRILIPQAVQQELLRGHMAVPSFIEVREMAESSDLRRLRTILDEGEACAIALAKQIHADLILLDEKKGRAAADQAGLRYIGLVGVLVEAKWRGVISAVRPILERLVEDAGFRLAPSLRAAVLREAKEN